MQIDQAQYEKFLKFQESAEKKAMASKRWNAKLRILASKALEAGMTVTDEEVMAYIKENKEINL